MEQYLQKKKGLVQNVFNEVYDKYDLMNDFMSLGVHRSWKKSLIHMMNPSLNKKLIDVACGTGDIGKVFFEKTDKLSINLKSGKKIFLTNLNPINLTLFEIFFC